MAWSKHGILGCPHGTSHFWTLENASIGLAFTASLCHCLTMFGLQKTQIFSTDATKSIKRPRLAVKSSKHQTTIGSSGAKGSPFTVCPRISEVVEISISAISSPRGYSAPHGGV